MSYSFSLRAASKEAMCALIATRMAEMAAEQPVHAVDVNQAKNAACAMVNLLPDAPDKDVTVSLSGYVSGHWDDGKLLSLTTASVNVCANLSERLV
jgi:hypothetical protein